MALVAEITKNVIDATPVYAVVGVTDLAAERVRTVRMQVVAVRATLTAVDPMAVQRSMQKDLTATAERTLKQVQDVPAVALERTLELAGKVRGEYDALAARGEDLVGRIRTQKATQDLVAQVDQTVAASKGAVTTVRKAVASTQASAKSTITTGRHQATKVAGVASDVAVREVKEAREAAEIVADAAADATRTTATAAKRTRTTARKGAKASTSRARATATSARKSAPRARKATTEAAKKVG